MLDQSSQDVAEPEARAEGSPAIRHRVATVEAAVAACFVVPLVAWAWRIVGFGNRFQYWSDNANIELTTLDVGREFVAIGSYSRMVWSHPGPLAFYLLALPSRLSRQNSIGLALGVLAINAAAVAGMLILARRRGGTPMLLLTAGMLAVFLHGLGPAFLVDVWNPSLPVLPYALLLFLCWGVALKERGSLPLAVAVATFCVHEHVGYVVVAGFPLLAAVLIAFRSTWVGPKEERRQRLRPWFRSAAVALVVGLVLWAPPIIQEIEGDPGNLILLGAYFNDTNGEPQVGLGDGWERQSMALGVRPTWATGEPPAALTFLEGWRTSPDPPVTLGLLALGLFLAVRRRDREGAIGGTIATVGVLTGLFAASRITGFLYSYLTRWSMAVGWFATLVGVWLVVRALIEWRPTARRATVSAATALLVVMALLLTSNVVHERNPQDPWGPIAHELAVQVRDNLPPGDGPVQLLINNDYQAMAHRSALVTALERVGIETEVDNTNPVTHGEWRTGFAENPRITLVLATDDQIADHVRAGFPLIAKVNPQSPREQRETERYLDELDERLAAGDHPSWQELERAAVLSEVHTIAVFQTPDVE
jgi:MYXO-CTERM domain-containing protein